MTFFNQFQRNGVYRFYLRGGGTVVAVVKEREAVRDVGPAHIQGRAVRLNDLKTDQPDRTVEEYVDDQNLINIQLAAIDAKEFIGALGRFKTDTEEA